MEKIKIATYVVAGILAMNLATSCSDFLDKEPDTELNTEMVFENRDKVYSWMAYVYNIIHTPDKWALTSDGYEILADDLVASKRWEQWDWREVLGKIYGQWTINSTWGGNLWHMMPRYIRHGYIFEEMAHALPEDNLPQGEIDNMKNEIKFLCAYGWWLLAENYGGIPFKPDYIAPTDFTLSELMVGQSKFDDVVNYCDQQMLEAANALPAVYDDPSKYGRINKIMALTVRARMLLFAASPLVNGNKMYADYRNNEGEQIFNMTYDHQKWVKAVEACKLCIDEAEKAGYELYKESGPDGGIDPFMSTYNVHIKKWSEGNHEITFPVTKGNAYRDTYLRVTSVRDYNGGNGLGVYQGLVDAFFTENGLPIDDPNSGYTETGFSTSVESRPEITKWSYGTGVEGEITARGTYNMYCHREPRFYNAVSFHNSWLAVAGRPYNFLFGGADNIQSSSPHDAPQNGYLARKGLCVTDDYKSGSITDRQAFIYRLAFTYLDYAEALNETYDEASRRNEAIEYVNRIRERAGVRQYTFSVVDADDEEYIHIENTQESVRKAIRMERRVELSCENNRWYDIRRWMIAEDIPEMTGDCMGMNSQGRTRNEFHHRTATPGQTRVWKKQYYWFPIYIDEYEKNPNLVEGPFWVD
ncbi:MAG: RagB/SusD family nutrient uptake outer membrane protein [Prevotella sp.]|nr:RagB/SusD family nutrient uptake outer membrane protein [Prevotella sp.]